jgi:FkbM family methyltransferase
MEVQPRTHKFLIGGTYELALQRAITERLGGTGVYWDVGAHIGFFSLLAARSGADVVCVEPSPENAQRIRTALVRNGLRAEVIEAAAGSSCGIATFSIGSDSSTGVLAPGGIPVELVSLDRLLEARKPPDLVKIDVEGHEHEVLAGATRLIETVRPTFILELHPHLSDSAPVRSALDGYVLTTLDSDHVLATPGGE